MPGDLVMDFAGGNCQPSMEFLYDYNEWKILEALVDPILYFRPYCVVEIGSGESTEILAKASDRAEVAFYSCDKSPDKHPKKACTRHKHYQMMSDQFMGKFNDTPAIVLIDGDHRYETAKGEFYFFYEKLVPGGVIFIHDTFPPHKKYLELSSCGDVYKLRQELEKKRIELDMDIFTWPYTAKFSGLTMVTKKDEDRPYWGK